MIEENAIVICHEVHSFRFRGFPLGPIISTHIIKELPEGITSGSMRDGSLSELMARNVPDGIIKMAGGHADGEFSSMFEYQINLFSFLFCNYDFPYKF